jgi:hypothetical protein
MRELLASIRARSALFALESAAARAGDAMACSFGSSAEFEAVIIRSRLAALYRRKRWRDYILGAAIVACCVLTLVCLI